MTVYGIDEAIDLFRTLTIENKGIPMVMVLNNLICALMANVNINVLCM